MSDTPANIMMIAQQKGFPSLMNINEFNQKLFGSAALLEATQERHPDLLLDQWRAFLTLTFPNGIFLKTPWTPFIGRAKLAKAYAGYLMIQQLSLFADESSEISWPSEIPRPLMDSATVLDVTYPQDIAAHVVVPSFDFLATFDNVTQDPIEQMKAEMRSFRLLVHDDFLALRQELAVVKDSLEEARAIIRSRTSSSSKRIGFPLNPCRRCPQKECWVDANGNRFDFCNRTCANAWKAEQLAMMSRLSMSS